MIQRSPFGAYTSVGLFNQIFPHIGEAPFVVLQGIPFTNMTEFIIAMTTLWNAWKNQSIETRQNETISDELFAMHIQMYQLVTTKGYRYKNDFRSFHQLIKKAYTFCEKDEKSMKYASKKFETFGNFCSASFYRTKAQVRNEQKSNIKRAFPQAFA